ncbi:MAG: DUF1015 domain-containing protein [Candidatus Omnitrophota bacterium]|nr:MAG: DUF1015 domain-containing protein [Candidatus Omnitrophota bacterium]
MAEIKPFRGILYNREKIDIAKVITPPYDVISPSMQNRFYQRDEHNIIRLILGKAENNNTSKSNRYARARVLLDRWMKKKFLVKDGKPAIYIYTQEYLYKGKKRTRLGFIALMKIEDPKESGILPHEYTLDKPKADRLNLIVKTKANLSPIFSLFQDKKNQINKLLKHFIKSKDPLFTIEADGVIHKFWRMNNKYAINSIKKYMRDKKIFIADGHHRYEVALAYRNKMRRNLKSFKKPMDYVMMYFSNLSERGSLTILSTHRVVKNINQFDEKKIKLKLRKYFYIKNLTKQEDLLECLEKTEKKKRVFGMYMGKKRFYLLTSKETRPKFDVTVLHDLIINEILGVKNRASSIKYIRNEEDAIRLIDKGDYKIAFFLRPTRVHQMKAVAEKGQMMPQKSTYFYPKLLTGLVINKF